MSEDMDMPCRSLLSAIGDAQAIISAIGFNGGADSKGYEAIDNKARLNLQIAKHAPASRVTSLAVQWVDAGERTGIHTNMHAAGQLQSC